MHLLEGDLPTIYHIAEAEGFGAIALVRIVELLAIYQCTAIVYTHDATDSRRDLPFACLKYLVLDTVRKALDAFLYGQVFQELDILLFVYFFFAHGLFKNFFTNQSG